MSRQIPTKFVPVFHRLRRIAHTISERQGREDAQWARRSKGFWCRSSARLWARRRCCSGRMARESASLGFCPTRRRGSWRLPPCSACCCPPWNRRKLRAACRGFRRARGLCSASRSLPSGTGFRSDRRGAARSRIPRACSYCPYASTTSRRAWRSARRTRRCSPDRGPSRR